MKYLLILLSGKIAVFSMNRVRVLTVIVIADIAARVDQHQRSTLVTGACQNTKANFSLLPIYNRQIVCGLYLFVYGRTC